MANEIDTAVDAFLESAGIFYNAAGGNRTTRENHGAGKPWECFAWRVSFHRTGKPGNLATDFFRGLGHVKPRRHHFEGFERPLAPTAAAVLYSLILDSDAADQSFMDWCADYGYSDDSLSALDTYRACCAIAVKLRAFFSTDERAKLADLLADY
jgi:hypothetical protein